VEDYVSTRADVEGALRSFQEMISYVLHLRLSSQELDKQANRAGNINSCKPTPSDEPWA
jgi:hypothetical protein